MTLQQATYVVAGRPVERVNDRVMKLLTLRDANHSVTLVTPGSRCSSAEELRVPPRLNPTGLLRWLGLLRLKEVLDRQFLFPSTDIRFVWSVLRPLANRINEDLAAGKAVTLLVTFPPHALGRLGVKLKARFPQLRLVLDWQDLWSYDPNYFERTPLRSRPKVRRWETDFLDSADLNITTNARAAKVLVDEYGADAGKVEFIEHHYHPDDLDFGDAAGAADEAGASPHEVNPDAVRLGFMGTLDKPPRVPGMALADLVADVNAEGYPLTLDVFGHLPNIPVARRDALADRGVTFHGLVSHEQATRELLNYSVLVLLLADMPNSRTVLSIKLPHYLLANRPILAIVPADSAIADVIVATGAGRVIDSGGDWQQEVRTLFTQELSNSQGLRALSCARKQSRIEQYHWDQIALRWQQVLTGDGPNPESNTVSGAVAHAGREAE